MDDSSAIGRGDSPTTLRNELAVVALFAVLAVAGTWPLALNPTSAVPAGGDSWAYYWNLYWVKRALVDLQVNPFIVPDLYFPYGASLYFHTLNLLPGALVSPIVALWGVAAGFNGLVLVSFVTTGYATYRLAWYVLTIDNPLAGASTPALVVRMASVLAGVVFTFSSYRYVHLLGHLDLVSTQWLPCCALFMLKAVREKGWLNPILAAVFFAAAALTALYYLLFLVVFACLLAAWTIVSGWTASGPSLRRLAGAGAIAILLLIPVLIPMIREGQAAGRSTNPAYDIDRFSGDLVGPIVPSPLPAWSRRLSQPVRESMARPGTTQEGILFLGFLPLLLAAIGLTRRASRGFWFVSFVVFTALALGPTVYALGRPVPILSAIAPYRLLLQLPFGDIPRVPARFIVMAGLSLSVLSAIGACRLFGRRPATAPLLMTLIGALIVAEHAVVPLPLLPIDVPPYYAALALSADRRGVVEVPIPADPSAFPQRMLFQTVHQKPVYGGYLARGLPPLPFAALPGFSQFVSCSSEVDDVVRYDSADVDAVSLAVLDAYRAGHVVIDRAVLTPSQVERARAIADRLFDAGARVYEDARTLAYVVPPNPTPGPTAVWLDTGWSHLERNNVITADGKPERWRWMGVEARLGARNSEASPMRLRFRARAFGRARRLQLSVNGTVAGVLTIGVDQADYETPDLPVTGEAGFIELRSLDGADAPGSDPRRLSVAFFSIEVR